MMIVPIRYQFPDRKNKMSRSGFHTHPHIHSQCLAPLQVSSRRRYFSRGPLMGSSDEVNVAERCSEASRVKTVVS